MSQLYLKDAYAPRAVGATSQSEPIPGRETEQIVNSAGGYVFPLDDWARLDRFLVLGSEGATYYVSEKALTRDNAKAVERCIAADGPRVVARVVEISHFGRAPKNDPALFVLAMCAAAADQPCPFCVGRIGRISSTCEDCCGSGVISALKTRRAALTALPKVARIGTHLFHFAAFVEGFRGWGRALRRAVGKWYINRSADDLALQVVKYRQRDGWTHRDLLRLSHPLAIDLERRTVLQWVTHGEPTTDSYTDEAPKGPISYPLDGSFLSDATKLMKAIETEEQAVALIRKHRFPRECVPTDLLNSPEVWSALLEDMPMTAMIRNLGKMSAVGLLTPMSDASHHVVAQLDNVEKIRRARVHPIAILMALKTYAQGHGEKGSLQWTPASNVVDALDRAFYTAFQTVVPTGKRILLALDVSGSMGSGGIAGTSLTPREGAAAMAMVIANTEANYHIVGFTAANTSMGLYSGRRYGGMHGGGDPGITPLDITARQRLQDVVAYTSQLDFGGTDCSLPMQYAQRTRLDVDCFVILTDSETWAGGMHPMQALNSYRKERRIAAKLVTVGMVSNGFSIADPQDGGALDVVGFDAAAPQVIADFIRG